MNALFFIVKDHEDRLSIFFIYSEPDEHYICTFETIKTECYVTENVIP